ncbi:iron complex transport system substrate-binding protein [Rhizobium sp. RU36D]|nr:iron complex transport system substrate-binding protein [Rhizobium sp. RU36D]
MKLFRFRTISAALALTLGGAMLVSPSSASAADSYPDAKRIVSLGGTVTEIIYALGAGDRVIAVDTTSLYPPEATAKPNVGYMRQLSAEGILAQQPDLILAEAGAGPPDTISILKASSAPVVTIPTPPTVEGIAPKIRAVGAVLGKTKEAEALASDVEARLAALEKDIQAIPAPRKKVLFALSVANGRMMAAGSDTAANAVIGLAGGENATAAMTGYKPVNDEAVIAAAPEVLLVMENGGARVTQEEAFALPSLQSSPAAANKAFIAMDGLYLLGLGPRTPEAARDLAAKLYPDAIKP